MCRQRSRPASVHTPSVSAVRLHARTSCPTLSTCDHQQYFKALIMNIRAAPEVESRAVLECCCNAVGIAVGVPVVEPIGWRLEIASCLPGQLGLQQHACPCQAPKPGPDIVQEVAYTQGGSACPSGRFYRRMTVLHSCIGTTAEGQTGHVSLRS